MSIKFKPVRKINPRDLSLPAKHYAAHVSSGTTTLERLCKLVSDGSTVTEGDVYAVITGLVNAMVNEIEEGKTIEFGKLGNFGLSLSSEGVIDADELNSSHIKKSRLLYKPSKFMRKFLGNLEYTKYHPQ